MSLNFFGLAKTMAIIRELNPKFKQKILSRLEKDAPELASLAHSTSFLFQDIEKLDRKSLIKLIRDVDEARWLIAWKLCPETTKKILLEAMSKEKRKDFLEQAMAMGKISRIQVIKTQAYIAKEVREKISRGLLRFR